MEQELFNEVENLKRRLTERKPALIEALLAERDEIDAHLKGLGYEAPKKTRQPRAPKLEGSEPAKRKSAKKA